MILTQDQLISLGFVIDRLNFHIDLHLDYLIKIQYLLFRNLIEKLEKNLHA